ncbi:restriction endonuclease subunit S [Treponema denticola]|nr:restriction endonuclease subunit S [Treponema denticola]
MPEGWAWCRLPEVCRKPITDGTHNSPSNSASGDFLYITAKNIKNLDICLDDATYISKEIHESIYSRCSPELNDILLTKDGTIGEVAVNKLNYPFSMLSSVALIKPSNEIFSWFLAYILISDLLQNKMKKDAKGSALKRIILAQINDFLIPLPPLAEQQRIVTKIEELFAQFDFITTAL